MSSLSVPSNNEVAERETGPYLLCRLNVDVVLSEDGSRPDIYITCVEYWNGNLYVGTSAAEVLHYVLIPAGDGSGELEQFILATRLPLGESSGTVTQSPGVQQILVLPKVDKACLVCNGVLTFHQLPELSPLFTKLSNCVWVGGVDQDKEEQPHAAGDGVIMICQKTRIRLVKIGDRLQKVRDIELGGCSAIARRGNIACVADASSYSLLDVVERQRIPLFDISSTIDADNESDDAIVKERSRSIGSAGDQDYRGSLTVGASARGSSAGGHGRDSSVNRTGRSELARNLSPSPQRTTTPGVKTSNNDFPPRLSSLGPEPPTITEQSEQTIHTNEVQASAGSSSTLVAAPENDAKQQKALKPQPSVQLRPHITSPSGDEFLLTTGTSPADPGVGMFVNSDGDVVRGTLEFTCYPESLCVDAPGSRDQQLSGIGNDSVEMFALAVIERLDNGKPVKCLEIQSLDPSADEAAVRKHWLDIPQSTSSSSPNRNPSAKVGLRSSTSTCQVINPEIAESLGLRRLMLSRQELSEDRTDSKVDTMPLNLREQSEAQFVNRLSSVQAQVLVWAHGGIWWAVTNPLLVRLNAKLSAAVQEPEAGETFITNQGLIERTLAQVQGLEGRTELEFISLKYIRQKASLMLLMNLVSQSLSNSTTNERDRRNTEVALSDGEIDPRVILAILPVLRDEVVEGTSGIWLQNGLKELFDSFISRCAIAQPVDLRKPLGNDILQLTKRYLQIWRRKKGFGSVTNEEEVFQSVDAALLHTLLLLDKDSPNGPVVPKGSPRSELNSVVDHGVDCFERAIELLESFKRLYVLSRLYQSRKLSSRVLATWRRIIEGEQDDGGELVDGEHEVRRYLSKINDASIVEEYGGWLASRNPRLGVQVFADSNSKIKFVPARAVEVLKERAPNAVKDFLEHLVFDKNLGAYANDLITFYLDTVLAELSTSEPTRASLLMSYESYRALQTPKPTYVHFFADNAPTLPWCRARLRLLQLLGGSHGAASQYDVPGILSRLGPYTNELIPETIVLSGRQGRHSDAIRLLVHGLGDFDTAVRYCILGGESTYSPLDGSSQQQHNPAPSRQEQMALFAHLLEEFLRIEDLGERVAQSSELLQRFAGWFDAGRVLELVPEEWSVDLLATFLESALRGLVAERNETAVARALTSAENLAANARVVEKMDALGPTVVREGEV